MTSAGEFKPIFLAVLAAIFVSCLTLAAIWLVLTIGMPGWASVVIVLALIAAGGWALRFAGQQVTGNAPYWRDMSFGTAFGFVFAAVLLIGGLWYYLQPTANEAGQPNGGVMIFRGLIQILIGCAIVAWVFRFIGRTIGTAGTRKLFRAMPLTASFGILVIIIYAFLAIFAGVIAPYGQEEIAGASNVVPGGNPAFNGNPDFILGTDQIGRDLLSRLIYGAQNTVGIAFATTCLAFFIGGSLGFLAATFGGWLDQVLSRAVDALMAIPALIFALLLMTIATVWANEFGINRTIPMVFIIALIDATRVYRLARAVGLNIVVMDYIEAAKLRGEGLSYLIFREMLPNATAPLLAEFGLRFCFVFLTIASLSFLGVGIQPPLADWGTMVKDLSGFINNLMVINEDWASALPGEMINGLLRQAFLPLLPAGAIALLTVAVNFVVDWVLDRSSGLKE